MSLDPGIRTTTRAELSSFLKSRRARIAPAAVGLQNGQRRRTPGLRREEVADLAGVGLTWYTWLEQGRDIRVSAQVLGAIGRALQLEPSERAHLFRLAGHAPPAVQNAPAISPRLQSVLDAWDPYPAQIAGRRRDILAWNRASDAIYGWSRFPDEERNSMHVLFLDPATRRMFIDWENETAVAVAAFRADAGRDISDPDYQQLINQLTEQSPQWAALWLKQDVRGRPEGLKKLQHAKLGRINLEFTIFQVAEQPSLRLYLYTPGDERTEIKLREAIPSRRALTSTT
jgi:transcriptional regulator with XRE-family HTH domain